LKIFTFSHFPKQIQINGTWLAEVTIRLTRDPWGKIWQRQPNLYPWEEIKSSDSLEEAIAKAKIIYRDSVMSLENWELKNILSTTHPNYCE
jgi:hypothetical protein